MPERQRKNRWSAEVTAHSDALDLEPKVFEKETAGAIAASLKRSASSSDRRKTSAFRSAMSMLTFYINRAGETCLPSGSARWKRRKENCANCSDQAAHSSTRGDFHGAGQLGWDAGADRWNKGHHDGQADASTWL